MFEGLPWFVIPQSWFKTKKTVAFVFSSESSCCCYSILEQAVYHQHLPGMTISAFGCSSRQVSRKVPLGAQMEKFRCPPLPTPPGSSWRIALGGSMRTNSRSPQGPKVSQAPNKNYCITLRGKDHLKSSWKYASICFGD